MDVKYHYYSSSANLPKSFPPNLFCFSQVDQSIKFEVSNLILTLKRFFISLVRAIKLYLRQF